MIFASFLGRITALRVDVGRGGKARVCVCVYHSFLYLPDHFTNMLVRPFGIPSSEAGCFFFLLLSHHSYNSMEKVRRGRTVAAWYTYTMYVQYALKKKLCTYALACALSFVIL